MSNTTYAGRSIRIAFFIIFFVFFSTLINLVSFCRILEYSRDNVELQVGEGIVLRCQIDEDYEYMDAHDWYITSADYHWSSTDENQAIYLSAYNGSAELKVNAAGSFRVYHRAKFYTKHKVWSETMQDWYDELDDTLFYECWAVQVTGTPVSISFDSNGGECNTKSKRSYLHWRLGAESGTLPEPVRTGYTFLGWYTEREGGSQVDASTIAEEAYITLYAHWEVNRYTLRFDGKGEYAGNVTGSMEDMQDLVYDGTYRMPECGFSEERRKFVCWNTSCDGDGESYHPGDSFSCLSDVDGETVSLYAIWESQYKEIPYCVITLDSENYVYDGTEKKPAVSVRDGLHILREGKDYILSYRGNVHAGEAAVIIQGLGRYSGKDEIPFTICGAELDARLSVEDIVIGESSAILATGRGLSYVSEDPAIAWVDADGIVTGVAAGQTKITVSATTGDFAGSQKEVEVSVSPYRWNIKDGRLTVICAPGSMPDFNWRNKVFAPWYSDRSSITSLLLKGDVSRIGDEAFYDLPELETVSLPESVREIGHGSFAECESLRNITLPRQLEVLGDYCFRSCKALERLALPEGLRRIGETAFMQCDSLKTVVLPDGLEEIGIYAFYGCDNIRKLSLPHSLERIPMHAFAWLASLEELYIPEGVTEIDFVAFDSCFALSRVYLPKSLKVVDGGAFDELRLYNKPEKRIIYYAGNEDDFSRISTDIFDTFEECVYTCFNEVVYNCAVDPFGAEDIGSGTLGGLSWRLDGGGTLHIDGDGAIPDVSAGGAPWYANREDVYALEISDGVTGIGEYAFEGCSALACVSLPKNLADVSGWAFSDCASLAYIDYDGSAIDWEGIRIGREGNEALNAAVLRFAVEDEENPAGWYLQNGVLTISVDGDMADRWESGKEPWADRKDEILHIQLEPGVTGIGAGAFEGCASLSSISLPSGILTIGENAFSGCTALASFVLPKGLTEIGAGTFEGCASLSSISLPSSILAIGENAFSGCEGLSFVAIPGNVERIGAGAFEDCTGLESVSIQGSTAQIGARAFANCVGLTDFALPEGNSEISAEVFMGCGSLKKLEIPEGSKVIRQRAFSGCGALQVVFLPASLETVEEDAFRNCGSLSSVSFAGSKSSWEALSVGSGNEYLRGLLPGYGESSVFGSGLCWILTTDGTMTIFGEGDIPDYTERETAPWSGEKDHIRAVLIGDGVGVVGNNAFAGCSNLTAVAIPRGLTRIGNQAFALCESLAEIALTDSVIIIEPDAFAFCRSLRDVYYDGTPEQWVSAAGTERTDALKSSRIHYGDISEMPYEIHSVYVNPYQSYVDILIENYYGRAAVLVIAYYDDKGKMLKLTKDSFTISTGSTQTLHLDLPRNGWYRLRVFVLDPETCQPLSESKSKTRLQ